MSIPPPPKINPSALALGTAAANEIAKQRSLGVLKADADGVVRPDAAPLDKRDIKVPAGYKKVYKPNIPHQGAKEMARRARQMAKGIEWKCSSCKRSYWQAIGSSPPPAKCICGGEVQRIVKEKK